MSLRTLLYNHIFSLENLNQPFDLLDACPEDF